MKRVGWDPRKLAKSNFLLAQLRTFLKLMFMQNLATFIFLLCCAYHDYHNFLGCYVLAVRRQSPEYVPPINVVLMHLI